MPFSPTRVDYGDSGMEAYDPEAEKQEAERQEASRKKRQEEEEAAREKAKEEEAARKREETASKVGALVQALQTVKTKMSVKQEEGEKRGKKRSKKYAEKDLALYSCEAGDGLGAIVHSEEYEGGVKVEVLQGGAGVPSSGGLVLDLKPPAPSAKAVSSAVRLVARSDGVAETSQSTLNVLVRGIEWDDLQSALGPLVRACEGSPISFLRLSIVTSPSLAP